MIIRFLQPFMSNLQDLDRERGQSIVLIALGLVGLLAMVGLAVDVGLVYARNAQLSNAVDAAALAGVVELNRDANEQQNALDRAAEFLNANNIPVPAIENTMDNGLYAFDADPDSATLGARTFAITVTQPVDLFFLRVIGRDTINVTESATASNFPLADIYASRRVETGALSTSNQAVFGPNLCVDFGDPFSSFSDPLAQQYRARWLGNANQRAYRYRILIPDNYEDQLCTGGDGTGSLCDVVRVEIFDADSWNQDGNQDTVVRTQNAIDYGNLDEDDWEVSGSCDSDRKNPCLIDTGEQEIADDHGLSVDHINPWWFRRIDENRGAGSPPGNGACSEPGNYTVGYNTITRYTLFYFQRSPDGVIQRVNLATYYGQSATGRDAQFSSDAEEYLTTDMRWISPGAEPNFDQPEQVYAYCDPSVQRPGRDGCTDGSDGPGSGFEIDISDDLVSIVRDDDSGARYIYMEVETISGASENGYELWAGPRTYVNSVSSNVNARNVQVVNNPSSHSSQGVTVFGLGHLPLNSNVNNRVEIPLIYVGPEYAGTSVYVSNYDSDSGASGPVVFYFDSIGCKDPEDEDLSKCDWFKSFATSGPDPDGETGRCTIGVNCNRLFVDPPYRIDIPTYDEAECDPDNFDIDVCTPFYGGRLMVSYDGGQHDTYHWNISLSGLPYLIR